MIIKYLHVLRLSITLSTRNALENKPKTENKPACTLNTKNELITTSESTVRSALPTSRFVNFFKIKAAISVPPEDLQKAL